MDESVTRTGIWRKLARASMLEALDDGLHVTRATGPKRYDVNQK